MPAVPAVPGPRWGGRLQADIHCFDAGRSRAHQAGHERLAPRREVYDRVEVRLQLLDRYGDGLGPTEVIPRGEQASREVTHRPKAQLIARVEVVPEASAALDHECRRYLAGSLTPQGIAVFVIHPADRNPATPKPCR
jgi:hypothetical protein